jgi:N-acetylglutamate synthase
VALVDGQVGGTLLCGHDGRRGYLHHLAVDMRYRRRGIGRELVKRGIAALEKEGISKCHLFLMAENDEGRAFWQRLGWTVRDDIEILSFSLETSGSRCRC